MKKLMKAFLSLMMVASLAACSSNNDSTASTDGKFTAGTYKGTAAGNNADVTVEVTLSADKIEKVEVVEHQESACISDAAITNIPQTIVDSQSLNVETISGATNTSKAIINAVTAALQEAGVDTTTLMSETEGTASNSIALENKTYDVVVLGAGGAGLAAAIEAKLTGASVAIIEKMPYPGGNTILSYAELACADNWLQEKEGIEDSAENMAQEMWEGGGKVANKEMVDIVANNALDAALWLKDEIGVEYKIT